MDKKNLGIKRPTNAGRKTLTDKETKNHLKNIILETVKKERPETTEQLIQLMQQRHSIPPEETANLLIELENENRLKFTKPQQPIPPSLKAYVKSRNALWFWVTVALAIATTMAVYAIPEETYPLSYIRNILGTIFVLFLPGYTFIKMLYPQKLPLATRSYDLDQIERMALSLGMSIALVPIVGLILNYTPWGIRLTPIVLSLLALTLIFAVAAVAREHEARKPQTQQN